MYRKTALLRGIAIVAVITAHSFSRAYIYHAPQTNVQGFADLWLLFQPRLLLIVRQLCYFAVPAFLLITGMFMTYAVRGQSMASDWKVVRGRIKILLPAFLFWSLVGVIKQMLIEGGLPSGSYWRNLLLSGEVTSGYYFILLLFQFYAFSIFLVPLAARRPKLILSIAITLQIISTLIHEVGGLWLNVWTNIPGLGSYHGLYLFTRWSLYFVIGVVVGTRTTQVEKWLKMRHGMFALATVLFGFLCVAQYILLKKPIWAIDQHLIFVTLYAISAIGFFFSLNVKTSRMKRTFEKLGVVSLPIYLIHPLIVEGVSKWVFKYTEILHNLQLIFAAIILFFLGLFIPWGIISMVKSRWFPFKTLGRKILGL
ncbi:acyltransferase [Desulfosarcina ovata]|uniref:acyltransferase n=1 Tax=Desulfosarcina ovata TaxID=83564 RepID=UPI0015653F9D|nr:acyltransferase [Desulfosarcina ovata]